MIAFNVTNWFRGGFYGGLGAAIVIGLFLLWLWQPDRQIQRHTENLFHALEHKNWQRVAEFIGSDYEDQWGHDRAGVIERARAVFAYLRDVRISYSTPTIRIDSPHGRWIARIRIETDESEVGGFIKERINTVTTPFELEWRRVSSKPWDWKLVRVSNSTLELPESGY